MAFDFERLFEALPSAYMVIDRSFSYVAVNRAYEEAVSRGRKDIVGRHLFDLFPNDGESGQLLRASFRRVFDTGQSDTVAYIPYDIPVPEARGGGMEQRFWTAIHQPLTDETGAVAYLVQNTTDVTDLVRIRQAASLPFSVISGETRLLERAREAEAAHRTLLAESDSFRRLFQLAPGFFAVLSGPNHVFTFANDAYGRLVGGRDVVGKSVAEALPEVVDQGFVALLDRVYATGTPVGGVETRLMLQQAPGQAPRETFLDFSYDAIRDRDGNISGIFVQGMDRTEAVRTQQRQRLLLDELNHRVKNTLATVQSIAAQTLRPGFDPNLSRERFEARLRALSNAHNLLSEQKWASASLADIVRQEFGAHDGSRIVAEGEPVTLSPKHSIALALVVHELATNAAKHGALSSPDGRVGVRWSVPDGRLVIDWEERGGPAATQPTHRGFGSRLIERVVGGELGGLFEARYGTEGFSCRMDVPLAAAGGEEVS
jgi:PAS domain S-box-containing protein